MKRTIALLCVLVLSLSLCGCSGVMGGIQERNIGTYMPMFTDGNKDYLEYELYLDHGYFSVEEESFTLSHLTWPDETLQEQWGDTRIVSSLFRTGIYDDGVVLVEEFSYLSASIDALLAREDYIEYVLLCSNGEIYGILNCYKRPAGRSGSLLAYEDLKYSCLLGVEDGQLVLGEPMKDVALLACNRTHYVAYGDKTIYSVCKQTDERTQILEDLWWNQGPNYYGYVDFYYTDEVFYFSGRQNHDANIYSLYACNMDGTGVQLLLNRSPQ